MRHAVDRDVQVQAPPAEGSVRGPSSKSMTVARRALDAEVTSLLGMPGRQIWFRQIDRPGTCFGEVAAVLHKGTCAVRPWGADCIYELHADSVRAIGIACIARWSEHQKIAQRQHRAAADGRFGT